MFGLNALGFGTTRTPAIGEWSGPRATETRGTGSQATGTQATGTQATGTQETGTPGLASGMVAGSRVATAMGWRPVEGILPGDLVLIFDSGLQRVAAVQRGHLWSSPRSCPSGLWPLRVAPGAIGNAEESIVLPEQPVMIESDLAENMLGDPFALIPGAALAALPGVEPMAPPHDLDVVILHFGRDQIVFVDMGALFFCPAAAQPVDLTQAPETDIEAAPYDVLPLERAADLLSRIGEGAAAGLWRAMPGATDQAA